MDFVPFMFLFTRGRTGGQRGLWPCGFGNVIPQLIDLGHAFVDEGWLALTGAAN